MIKLALITICLASALAVPFKRFEVYDDVANDAEVIDAGETLPGTRNLAEKRLPVIRLTLDGAYLGSSVWGDRNLAERIQVPPMNYDLPGSANLGEKSLPDVAIFQRTSAVRQPDVVA